MDSRRLLACHSITSDVDVGRWRQRGVQLKWKSARFACEKHVDRYPASPVFDEIWSFRQVKSCVVNLEICFYKCKNQSSCAKPTGLCLNDRSRSRTCNLRIRSPTPYPLGHTTLFERARTPFMSSKCSQRSPFFKQYHQALVLWCNWSALRTLNPVIRVQVSVEPISGVVSISNL